MRDRVRMILLLVAGAVMYAAAYPPVDIDVFGWIAPMVWMIAITDASVGQRLRRMFLIGYLGSLLIVYWLTALFSTLAVVLWLLPAAYFALWGVIAGWRDNWSSPWLWVVWPAVAWVGLEFLRCEIAPLAFSFGSLGSSQANWAGFQLASWVGVYGVSGLMVALSAFAHNAWKRQNRSLLLVAFGMLALFGAGALVPVIPRKGAAIGTAILQQLKQSDDIGAWNQVPPREEKQLPDLIVWPELTFADDPRLPQSSWFFEMMQKEAAQSQRGVIFGGLDYFTSEKTRSAPYYNSAFLLSPAGEIAGVAGKNQPVQLMKDGLPAPDVVVMDLVNTDTLPLLRAGVGVCYDGCFQRYSRRMISRGADFLIFPTMNLEAWGANQHRQHQQLFQMRAAETGRMALIAAVSGPTFAAYPGGAASEVLPFHKTGSMVSSIQEPRQTIFNVVGWLTGPVCLGLTLLGILWKIIKGIKLKRSGSWEIAEPGSAVKE